jgi:nonribosomal peptide synthetase DhbF
MATPESLPAVLTAARAVFGPHIGAGDGFFDVGGDSVTAVELAARLSTLLGTDVDVTEILDADDFAGLAEVLTGRLVVSIDGG